MNNRNFERLLLKNTMSIAVPAMAVLFVLSFFLTRFSVFAQMKNVNLDQCEKSAHTLEDLYKNNTTNVIVTLRDIYYTGFDYHVNNKIQGAYYYSMDKDSMNIYLINTDNPAKTISDIEIKGKIVRDDITLEHIIQRLAEQSNTNPEFIKEYVSLYIISEPDYPNSYVMMMNVFFLVPIILGVLVLLYTIIIWFIPRLHPQCRQLLQYGDVDAIIEELNGQLRSQLIFRKNGVYITRDYMVVNYFNRTDVIKLDCIKYLSKNLIPKREILSRTDEVFRLTMSDPDKNIFYEVDFINEELIDDVVNYIRGVNKGKK